MNLLILVLAFIIAVLFIGSFLKRLFPVVIVSVILIVVITNYFNVPVEKQLEFGERLAVIIYNKIKAIDFKEGIEELKKMWEEIRRFNVSLKKNNNQFIGRGSIC